MPSPEATQALDTSQDTIQALARIEEYYRNADDAESIPPEFGSVVRYLQTACDGLSAANEQIRLRNKDDSACTEIKQNTDECKRKATRLKAVFLDVIPSRAAERMECYRKNVLDSEEGSCVEILMQDVLNGICLLLTVDHEMEAATESQISKLNEAVDQLLKVKSSIPDTDFKSPGGNSQYVASRGTGYQTNVTGRNNNVHSGSGPSFSFSGTHATLNYVQTTETAETRSRLLQILNTSKYKDRKNRNPDRVPGTCEWFTNHDQFKLWQESKSSRMLWVSANPGCGKSVLVKYLVDSELETIESRTTCYFFFKDDYEDQKSARSALSCLLHQLFTQRKDLFSDKIIQRLRAYKEPPANSYYEFWELWDLLVMAAHDKNAGEIVCILDAFDECEDLERQDLTNALCKLYGPEGGIKENIRLKFLISSRPYDKIRRGFNTLTLPVIHLRGEGKLEISEIAKEINVYIKYRVSRIRENLDLNSNEEQQLLHRLQSIPNQTYLWVYLTLEWIETEINNKITERNLHDLISSLPRTVNEAYQKILSKSEKPQEAKRLLHIIVAAAWPLTLAEIGLALTLTKNHKSYNDVDHRPDERVSRDIRDLCGLFINIRDSKVYLLHQTAKEFLVPKNDLDPLEADPQEDNPTPKENNSRGTNNNHLIWKHSLQPEESHRILCQICIWHLLFTEFESNPLNENSEESSDEQVSRYLRTHIYLSYSAVNWATHFRASATKDKAIMESLQRICDVRSRRCMTWFRVYWASTHTGFPRNFSTLMMASYFGLEHIVELLLEMKDTEINNRDDTYLRSALSWASENGFDGVVKLLIKRPKIHWKHFVEFGFPKGAEIESRDLYGRTPLSYAAWNGHMAIVQRLIKSGARVDSKDEIGGTPISYALCSGQADVANRLMKGAQTDSVDRIRRQLLLSAAKKGHEPIVKQLLENGANIEAWGHEGYTPLFLAAWCGHEATVKLLLDKGADLEAKGKHCGRTPLCIAAWCGHEAIVMLLLDKGADLEAKSKSGRTPLYYAAANGYEAMVKLLLDKGADLEAKDKSGWTPLSLATAKEYTAIIRLFLDMGAYSDAKDRSGRAAFLSD